MKEKEEAVRFTGQPSGHNYFGISNIPQSQIDKEVVLIKDFAKDLGLSAKDKKNHPTVIIVPEDRMVFPSFNGHKRASLLVDVTYAFYYTKWNDPISIKKNWNGYMSRKDFKGSVDDEGIKEDLMAEIASKELSITNLLQIELGRFKNISDAFSHIKKDFENNTQSHHYSVALDI